VSPPEPEANPYLFGHDAAEATLAEAARAGRLHHGWLLHGPPGVGKATLAFRFARWLLAGAPSLGGASPLAIPEGHPVMRRIIAGGHADLRVLRRTMNSRTDKMRGEIVVDDVRAAAAFMRLTPAEGGWRVLIIDRADDLNTNAANALLKLLEEPPPRAVLLLISDAPGRLLPTLRSRCRRLALAPLEPRSMRAALDFLLPAVAAPAREQLGVLAEGAPGRALFLADGEGLRLAQLVDEVLAALPSLSERRAYAVADQLGRGETAFTTFMELLRKGLATAVRDAARGGPAPRFVAARGYADWSAAWGEIGRIQAETEGLNLEKRVAVAQALGLLAGRAIPE
jgi:DNA polymerase-3 subunit delta'